MKKVTLLKGDGIGPEIINCVLKIFKHLDIPITFDEQLLGMNAIIKYHHLLPLPTLESIKSNKVVLKAPYQTEVGQGFRSVNVTLRQVFDLYANIRPIKTMLPNISLFDDVDLVIFRENTEDLYIGKEEIIIENEEVNAIKKITRHASERIIKQAFEYARLNKKNKVTCVHKANILKESDGLFLKIFYELAKNYPNITVNDLIVDNAAMQLVIKPQQFDVMVMPNLYGDILSDLASGLIGGLGLAPSANIGAEYALFEACHGCAPDIAGQNIANPTAIILSSCMMLEYLKMETQSKQIKNAVYSTLKDGFLTADLDGKLTTTQFTKKLISYL